MESNKQSQVIARGDYIVIGDLEEMQFTSKVYSIKPKSSKKCNNSSLVAIFFVIFTFYLSILVLYPFFKNIRSRLVRQMSELNGNVGLNQNYKTINPRDKNYTYIPIVGTDDIHGYFFSKS